MTNRISYISLETLAATLGLPQRYLKALANKKQIPYLNVNGRLRFNIIAVQAALSKIATSQKEGDDE